MVKLNERVWGQMWSNELGCYWQRDLHASMRATRAITTKLMPFIRGMKAFRDMLT
jgi:hypothetical protein